jgi:hypothetical protein
MKCRARLMGLVLALLGTWSVASAATDPYTDPAVLEMPWGNYSFVRQAWRGYVETVPAVDYLNGLGIVWGQSVPGMSADQMAAALAWAGFRRARIEIPWGSVRWDETGLEDATAARLRWVLRGLRAHGLRPLILLNANHLQPCPVHWRSLRVQGNAPAGARRIVVAGNLSGIQPLTATIMSLADSATPGPLIQSIASGSSPAIELSKPLTRSVPAGEVLRIAVFRYQPLYPPGNPAFESTAGGWLRYVGIVTDFVEQNYGSDDFDVEIWNELTFGSGFLDINNYLDPKLDFGVLPEPFHPGGRAWELAARTVAAIHQSHPAVQVIWGFSNTTFFNVPIPQLPPRLDGQSYHPYGTGRRCYAGIRSAVLARDGADLLLDDYVPPGCSVQPEGYAHTWQQTESLVRLIAPAMRGTHPPGSAAFHHYITEHGFSARELGIGDPSLARTAKQKFLLRAPLFWLNKGISALYVYDAYEPDGSSWGMFDAAGVTSAGMIALHRLTARLAGAIPLDSPRPLSFGISRTGGDVGVFLGDGTGRHLSQRDAVAILPFQLSPTKFAVGIYVMTQDFPTDLAPQPYRVTVSGLNTSNAAVTFYAPDSDTIQPVTVTSKTTQSLTLDLAITDVPRLIEINEAP